LDKTIQATAATTIAVPMSISMSDTENPRDVATVMVSKTHLRTSKRTSGIAVNGGSICRMG
jgi:hypothetical protein